MKNILILCLFLCSISAAYTQSCPNITNGTVISNGGAGMYNLTINYNGTGTKHLTITIFEGPVLPANLVSTTCLATFNSGVATLSFPVTGNDPRAVIIPGTGGCNSSGGGSQCYTDAQVITYSPLPVTLAAFSAQRAGQDVLIKWETAEEINAKEFILQQNSRSGYVDVQKIKARNNSNGASYTLTDYAPGNNNILYRLKMVDADDKYTYSETRLVKGAENHLAYRVYPNPVSAGDQIFIEDIAEPTDLILLDQGGQVVRQQTVNSSQGIKTEGLSQGMYLIQIRVKSSGKKTTSPLMVIK